jgi:hypothetical protein
MEELVCLTILSVKEYLEKRIRTGDVAQVVDHLSNNHKILSSIPSTIFKKVHESAGTLLFCLWECKIILFWYYLLSLKIHLLFDPAVPHLSIDTKEALLHVNQQMCARRSMAALFIIALKLKITSISVDEE